MSGGQGWTLWLPTTDMVELAIYAKLNEEMGELQSIVARCQAQGIDEADPDTGKSNRLALMEEVADVRAQLELLIELHNLPQDMIAARTAAKIELKRGWLAGIRRHLADL